MLYSRDNRELDLLLFWEVCDFVSRVDRVLSRPGGSLLLAGRSGVGRHTATCLVSHMHGYTLFTPKISRGYTLKHFNSDLKTVSGFPLLDFYLFIWFTLYFNKLHLQNALRDNHTLHTNPAGYTVPILKNSLLSICVFFSD